MAQRNNLIAQHTNGSLLARRMLVGAAIGLCVISVFLIPAGDGNPAWGTLWRIRPLVVVPLAGATAGVLFHMMDHFRQQGGWKKALANVVSVIVYVVGLWLGIVLGLDGTMWN